MTRYVTYHEDLIGRYCWQLQDAQGCVTSYGVTNSYSDLLLMSDVVVRSDPPVTPRPPLPRWALFFRGIFREPDLRDDAARYPYALLAFEAMAWASLAILVYIAWG